MSTTEQAPRPARAFDADNHYYEATDAFIRHVDPRMRGRCMRWADLDGKQRLLVGGKINRFIPNPRFEGRTAASHGARSRSHGVRLRLRCTGFGAHVHQRGRCDTWC